MKTNICVLLFLCTLISVFITGCNTKIIEQNLFEVSKTEETSTFEEETSIYEILDKETTSDIIETLTEKITSNVIETILAEKITDISESLQSGFDFSSIPKYQSKLYAAVNGNTPFFDISELTVTSFEKYSPLDSLGRCGVAYACVGNDIMSAEKRGSIGSVKPSGWNTVKYDNVNGKYLYNRCHLIGYQLTDENANEKNLIKQEYIKI